MYIDPTSGGIFFQFLAAACWLAPAVVTVAVVVLVIRAKKRSK